MTRRASIVLSLALALFGCSEQQRVTTGTPDLSFHGGNPDGGGNPDQGMMSCDPNAPDQAGCSCTSGASRACYSGPPATRNMGVCKDGTQTCSGGGGEFGGIWGPCTGDTLPGSETGHCADGIDNDCNGETDCSDGQCETDPGCASKPDMSMPPGDMAMQPGCTLPDQNGRCPEGTYFGVSLNGVGCCPCTAQTCDQPACCVTQACANAQQCGMCMGAKLDPACMGRVDTDCDDFPEDCDQLCCPCKPAGQCMNCPQGQIDCSQIGLGCIDGTSDVNHCGACDITCGQGQQCISGSCV